MGKLNVCITWGRKGWIDTSGSNEKTKVDRNHETGCNNTADKSDNQLGTSFFLFV